MYIMYAKHSIYMYVYTPYVCTQISMYTINMHHNNNVFKYGIYRIMCTCHDVYMHTLCYTNDMHAIWMEHMYVYNKFHMYVYTRMYPYYMHSVNAYVFYMRNILEQC